MKYNGRDMVVAHKGMEIAGAEFNALAKDLARSGDKFDVPANEKAELLAAVAATRASTVGK